MHASKLGYVYESSPLRGATALVLFFTSILHTRVDRTKALSVCVLQFTALSDAAAIASGHTAPSLGCPHGGIKQFTTPNGGFYCDVCGAAQEVGSVMFGCRKCDYDQCMRCHSEAMAWGSRVDALFDVFDLDEDRHLCKPEYRGYLRVVAADASVLDDALWDKRWAAIAAKHNFLLTIGMSRAKFRSVYRESGTQLEEHERRCGLQP